jgi:uncharacterized protein DUF4132
MNVGLEKESARLEALQPGLGERVLRYVATGESVAVLAELAALDRSYTGFYLNVELEPGCGAIFTLTGELPAEVMLRYAKCLAATLKRLPGAAAPGEAYPEWLEVFLERAALRAAGYPDGPLPDDATLTAGHVERMLAADGRPPGTLVGLAFNTEFADPRRNHKIEPIAKLPGFGEMAARHRDAAAPAFRSKDYLQRAQALGLLKRVPAEALPAFAGDIVALATDSSKFVRDLSRPLVVAAGERLRAPLQEVAARGKAAQRAIAEQLLAELGTQGGHTSHADAGAGAATEPHAPPPELPAIEDPPLPDRLRPAFDAAVAAINADVSRSLASGYAPKGLAPLSAAEAQAAWAFIAGESAECPQAGCGLIPLGGTRDALLGLLRNDGVLPVHILRTLRAFGELPPSGGIGAFRYLFSDALREHYAAHRRPSLLELEAMMAPLGFAPENLALTWLRSFADTWADDDVWPFFARHPEYLRDWPDPRASTPIAGSLRAIETFPEPPAPLLPTLFEMALGSGKAERAMAQRALAKLPGRQARIIAALADGKADTRAAAADWLGRLRHAAAIPALEAALGKEGNDVVMGAMMAALESLGVNLDKFLDRDALPAQAKKALAKGVPAGLANFPMETLPTVRWAGDERPVAPEVLQWFVVQAFKLKSPEPQALLQRYCAMFVPADRERFGQFALEWFLAEDLKTIPRAEAEARARQRAGNYHRLIQARPADWKDSPMTGLTEDAIYEYLLRSQLRELAGSAIEAKGVLAIATACCGRDAVAPTMRYLKAHYGTRIAQGKALVAMLAGIEHPAATQLMLSIANRFRTKALQDEAMRYAGALAEKRGWTLTELADRTMPTAGFDEDGVLELSYGERAFTARLGPAFTVELYNAEGKPLKSLPAPRQDEDTALAKEAKKVFAAAKDEIKAIVQAQTDRLYEALCTQRDWSFEDWGLYLNRHPVVRRLAQGLVWVQMRGGKVERTFRPLDDGTLTDVGENPVTLEPNARVALAHDTHLDPATVAAWQKHLADYQVSAPFQQLGKGVYELPAGERGAGHVAEFTGHIVEAFALRTRAAALGYVRGPSRDGAWFEDYRKRFPTLGLQAIVRFTGNAVPEQDRPVALLSLAFAPLAEGSWQGGLADVPAVLLSECYNDIRLMAAEGSGYDPDWEKKTQP